MKEIRSFLYLDNYKMYSISSQLFEGLTEYIVTNKSEETQESEEQKGPLGSGRILGDIIQKSSDHLEKKFLHDFSYNLFEQTLLGNEKVIVVDKLNVDQKLDQLSQFSFIKVKGRIVFNDLKIIHEMLANFNEFGYALGYITKKAEYDEQLKKLNEQIKQIQDRNQKAKAKDLLKNKTEFKKVLMDEGLQLDDEFLKHMSYLLNYGYNQQFEIQIPLNNDYLFTAQLDRNNLKDEESRIIKKYSRETEKEFVLFGILTQILKESEKETLIIDKSQETKVDEENNMKEAIMNVVRTIIGIEKTFTGKLNYEFVIDPIAVYMEL